MTLAMLATWFLVGEAGRGKKVAPAPALPQVRAGLAMTLRKARRCDTLARSNRERTRWRRATLGSAGARSDFSAIELPEGIVFPSAIRDLIERQRLQSRVV